MTIDNTQSTELPVVDNKDKTLIIYTDAGVRPTNPGHGGWGLHGYLAKDKESKVGAGHPTDLPSFKGYLKKHNNRENEVDVVEYYDALGPLGFPITNNVAEMTGIQKGLELALKINPAKLRIISDSKYAVNGISQWVDGWIKKKWRKPDGSEYSNKEEWLHIKEIEAKVKELGIDIEYQWINAHKGDTGNELADTYATIAVNKSRNAEYDSELNITEPKGYWKNEVEKNALLDATNFYFVSNRKAQIPGKYFCGIHGKDDDLLAVNSSDTSYSIVQLNEPEPILEKIKEISIDKVEKRSGDEKCFMIGRLNEIYKGSFYSIFNKFGKHSVIAPNPVKNTLVSVIDGSTQIVTDMRPPLAAWRALDDMTLLDTVLERYKAKDPLIIETDITDILYEKTLVKKQEVLVLKKEYGTGFNKLETEVIYNLGKENINTIISLVPGVSMPSRNSLKRLELDNPRISVITWKESDEAFRYATVVVTDKGIGIWSNFYANYRFLSTKIVNNTTTKLKNVL